MSNAGQFEDYDYDPPDPETRNVFNGFKYYISRHNAQIPPSFLCRLEEAPLPYHCQQRMTTEDNDNAQYTADLQPPLRNVIRSRTLSPVAGASGRSPVHTNIDRERDRKEGREMEQQKERNISRGRDKEMDRDRRKYRERDEHGDRDGRRRERDVSRSRSGRRRERDVSSSGRRRERYVSRSRSRSRSSSGRRRASRSGRRREREDVCRSRGRSRNRSRSPSRLRESHSKSPALKHEQVQWPNRDYPQLTSYSTHPPRYSACRGYEERRRNERVSPPPRRQRESGREEAEDPAEDTNDSMSADDILGLYNPGNDQEFNEMYTHPHEPLPHHIRELSQLDGPEILASPSREAIDAASVRQVELLANYNNCLQIEQEIRNNLKQSADFLLSTMKITKKLKERRFSCTQQHQKLQNEHSTLLAKLIPVNESWMDITSKELGLVTALSDNLKLMETSDGFDEIDKLNSDSNELQRQLEQTRENGLEMNRQLQAFRDAEINIANKLIEFITLSNSIDSSLKSEEEILKIRMEQHKSVIAELQAVRQKSETAKEEYECARQELYRLCPDLANKFD